MMEFRRAERRAIPVVLGLVGKSGSGKTYSALIMAGGMVGAGSKPEDIVLIDTERGRGSMYADDPRVPPYLVGELHPPFTSEAFVEAIRAAEKTGAKVIVVDSASHEWTGIGGALERHDEITSKNPKAKMQAWAPIKAAHRRFINVIAAPRCNLILCLRAKDKMEEQNGKWVKLDQPVPEQQADFIYDVTAAALIDGEHKAIWTKVPEPLRDVLTPGMITAEQGESIGAWVSGGAALNAEAERHLTNLREIAFDEGREGVTAYWAENIKGKVESATAAQLQATFEEVKAAAAKADAARGQERQVLASQDDDREAKANPVQKEAADVFDDPFTKRVAG